MLTPIELVPHARQELRRVVPIGCELFTERGGSRVESVLDLSAGGARVTSAAQALRGEEVLLSFVPPGARDDRLSTVCRVVHAGSEGILGLSFVATTASQRGELGQRLRGYPPPLPSQRGARRELVWVDALLTWEEDLGDRVNVFSVSEQLSVDEVVEGAVALAPLLGGGLSRRRWRAAS
jgi:hypothetical protein